jgi:L-seryl-tRNA(Ser) seleniumtransferase
MTDARRHLPSVSALLESDAVRPLLDRAPRAVVVEAIRRTIDAARGEPGSAPGDEQAWAAAVSSAVELSSRPSLRRVINATGVVLHTNLGRAPLAQIAIDAMTSVAAGFSNLEYDLDRGTRGSRYDHCASLLRELTGAEDALVVNNCAGALVLALDTIAAGRDAIVSRGELIEIGGSFRIPDIMQKSGVRLVEVGTTNRTHLDDYRRATGANSAAIVKVHRSNFELSGFVAEASASELAALAAERELAMLYDLGSGLLISLEEFGLRGEPTARDALRSGASLVTMSGDKLLGGPQAGLILGRREILDRVRSNPLTRSYRVDKLTLAALEATLSLYRDPARALREIPALAQLTCSVELLRERAGRILGALSDARVSILPTDASVGGGAFPTARISSVALAIGGAGEASDVEQHLRAGDPPVVARIADGRVLLDLRTVFASDDATLTRAIQAALA